MESLLRSVEAVGASREEQGFGIEEGYRLSGG